MQSEDWWNLYASTHLTWDDAFEIFNAGFDAGENRQVNRSTNFNKKSA